MCYFSDQKTLLIKVPVLQTLTNFEDLTCISFSLKITCKGSQSYPRLLNSGFNTKLFFSVKLVVSVLAAFTHLSNVVAFIYLS